MSFEADIRAALTKLRVDLRAVKADVALALASSGTPALSSETVSGVIQIASQSETDAGNNNAKAITPFRLQSRLAAFAQPLSTNLSALASVVSGATGRTLLESSTPASAKSTLSLVKDDVGLSFVDNTSDANKPVSSAQQTALNFKADTTALPTKTSLGLGNVDNTSDLSKPVSTSQQTALNLKANLASPSLTGTPTAPTPAAATNTTQIATTEFVQTVVAASTAGAPTSLDGGAP